MAPKKHLSANLDYAGPVAFVLIVLASYALWLVNAGSLDLANPGLPLAIGLGALYCVVGTVGFAWADRSMNHRLYWIAFYFLVQFALGFGASALLKGINSITILLIPLAWQGAMIRLRGISTLVSLLLGIGILILYYLLRDDWSDAIRMSATLIAGVVAAFLFGRVVVREQDARAEVARLADDLHNKNEQLRTYAATAEEAAIAAERNRLAREIHDSLGHYLTASAMQVQSARAMLGSSGLATQVPDVVDALRKAEGLSQEALTDVRRSVTALRETSIVQPSLPEALNDLCHITHLGDGLTIRLTVTGTQRPLTPQADLTLYRVAQEGLTNVYKHAQASFAQVALCYETECIRLTVEDDGIGLVAPDVNSDVNNDIDSTPIADAKILTDGFGLMGLRERISLLGGKIEMRNGQAGGFLLQVEVPL